jgi:hypothetical protein
MKDPTTKVQLDWKLCKAHERERALLRYPLSEDEKKELKAKWFEKYGPPVSLFQWIKLWFKRVERK